MIRICITGGLGWRILVWLEFLADTFDNLIGVFSLGLLQSQIGFVAFTWIRERVL